MRKFVFLFIGLFLIGCVAAPQVRADEDWLMPHTKSKLKKQLKNSTLVVYKNKHTQTYQEKGLTPLLLYLDSNKDFEDAHVFDKIVGVSDAYLYAYGDVEKVYADVMSKQAVDILHKYDIRYEADKIVPFIKDNQGNASPYDEIVNHAQTPAHAYGLIYKKTYPDVGVVYYSSDDDERGMVEMHKMWHPDACSTQIQNSLKKYIDIDFD